MNVMQYAIMERTRRSECGLLTFNMGLSGLFVQNVNGEEWDFRRKA